MAPKKPKPKKRPRSESPDTQEPSSKVSKVSEPSNSQELPPKVPKVSEPSDAQKPATKARRRRPEVHHASTKAKRRKITPEKITKEQLQKIGARFKEYVDLLLQNKDDTLINTRRLLTNLRDTKLLRYSKPLQTAVQNERYLASSLAPRPIAGRKFNIGVSKSTPDKAWAIIAKETGTKNILSVKKKSFFISFREVPETRRDIAKRIADGIEQVLLTWPFPVLAQAQDFSRLIVDMGAMQAGVTLALPVSDVGISNKSYRIIIKYIDADDGAPREREVALQPSKKIASTLNVPPVPSMMIRKFKEAARTLTPDNTWYETKVPPELNAADTSVAAQRKTQDALRWLSLQCSNLIVTRDRMEELLIQYQTQIGMKVQTKVGKLGVYGGSLLFRIIADGLGRKIRIAPSYKVAADISVVYTDMWITVNSLDASRISPVLDTLIQNYYAGLDVRRAFIEAAIVADQVNLDIQEGIPPTSICDCDDTSTGTVLHACQGCGTAVLCRLRKFDAYGRLVCISCFARYSASSVDGFGGEGRETLVEAIMRKSITHNFKNECKVRGRDFEAPAQQKLFKAAVAKLKNDLSACKTGTEYVDAYTGNVQKVYTEAVLTGSNPSKRRFLPSTLSVDAVFQVAQQNTFRHSKDNLVIFSVACQYAKGRSLPGVLSAIADFLNISSPSAKDVQTLMDTLEGLRRVRIKVPYSKDYATLKTEMVSGKPLPNEHGPFEGDWQEYMRHRDIPVSKGYIWDAATRKRLGALAEEIAETFGKKLEYGSDRVPWIGPKQSMPPNFTWNSAATFCYERLQRMRTICNKHWQTKDTEESLYAEIIFQYCTNDPKYHEFLGLPLAMSLWHALRLSIAHREHGHGMFSGWPPQPSRLSDRVDEDNNMLIETWYSNSAKMDIDEHYYSEIAAILKSVKLRKEFYDPQLQPHGKVDASLATAEVIEVGDDYACQMNEDVDGASEEDENNSGEGEEDVTGEGEEAASSGEESADQTQAGGPKLFGTWVLRETDLRKKYPDAWFKDSRVTSLMVAIDSAANHENKEDYDDYNSQLDSILEELRGKGQKERDDEQGESQPANVWATWKLRRKHVEDNYLQQMMERDDLSRVIGAMAIAAADDDEAEYKKHDRQLDAILSEIDGEMLLDE